MALMAKDFFVRVDDDLGAKIEAQAKAEGRTVSNLLRLILVRHYASSETPVQVTTVDPAQQKVQDDGRKKRK
jgi:antitoxin component of RelBE/YafQ-DinJ toxin-antitoxin module